MTEQEAKARIETLRVEILHHDKLYYEDNAPVLSDALYDARLRELRELEAAYPDTVTPASPTQTVSGKVGRGFAKVKHAKPMLSLYTETDFTDKGAYDFTRRVSAFLVDNKIGEKVERAYCCEPKFDGLAVTVRYEHGQLVTAATRGDGEVGEDVTDNIRVITNVPSALMCEVGGITITGATFPTVLEVRGEVMMPLSTFNSINADLVAKGEKPYVNARNAAAGSLRLLDPSESKKRGLVFYAYGVGEVTNALIKTQSNWLNYLSHLGFTVFGEYFVTKEPYELVVYHQRMLNLRSQLDFEIDGVVYKVDSLELQDKLGYSGREPRWAAAHKFEPEGAWTQVLGIDLQVGRTGKITPVARLQPVFVGGTTVSNVTLSNESEIRRKDIRVGDSVLVQRAGDVIPEIVRTNDPHPEHTQPYVFPTTCPECRSLLVRKEGEIDYRCSGGAVCPAQSLQKLIHFCSRKAMHIEGLGDKLLEQLTDAKVIQDPADIYSLGMRQKAIDATLLIQHLAEPQRIQLALDTLTSLEGIGLKTATALVRAIEASKKTTLPKLLYALGIRYAAEGTAKRLSKTYGSLEAIMKASQAELEQIDDIGPVVAKSVYEFFADPQNQAMLAALKLLGVTWEETPPHILGEPADLPLSGLTIVITGSCDGVNREDLKDRLEKEGATVSNAVTVKTDYLITGLNAGTKLTKALQLGIKTIDMQVFHPTNPSPPTYIEWDKPMYF